MYNLAKSRHTMNPEFDETRIQNHDLQIMDSTFRMSTKGLAYLFQTAVYFIWLSCNINGVLVAKDFIPWV